MVEILSLYHFIPPVEKRLFKSKIKQKNCKKGEWLLFDGEIQESLYFVRSGVLTLYFDQDKGFKIIDFAFNNRFCVDVASFSNQMPSDYCIQCLADGEIEYIAYEDLEMIFDAAPAVERAYRLLLERILAALIKKNLMLAVKSIEERFDWIMGKRPELFKLVRHKYVASYINIDPTNFSKLYKQKCLSDNLLFR